MDLNDKSHLNLTFLNSIKDAVIITDDEGLITNINNAALQLLGVSRDQFVGHRLHEVLVLQTELGQAANVDSLLIIPTIQDRKPVSIDSSKSGKYFLARSDRTQFPASITALPMQLFSGESGVTIIFNDTSAEEKIDQSKSEFVSLVSHQLRTPVNIVSWYAEKLLSQKKGDLNIKQQEYLREIMVSNKRIVDLVSAIVNVSRTDLERLKLKHEDVNLVPVIQEVIKQLQTAAQARDIKVSEEYDAQEYLLENSDREYVSSIVHNVLKNAIKYSQNGKQVNVKVKSARAGDMLNPSSDTKAHHDGVIIAISDTGLGIPDEQKDKVFTKLFRADNVKALDVTGLGLGLYIAKSFADMLQGTIWFTSRIREGSTFYIYLPK